MQLPCAHQWAGAITLGTMLGAGLGLVLGAPDLGVAVGLPLGVSLAAALHLRGSETTATTRPLLLTAHGQGEGATAPFTASGPVYLAWQVWGRSPSRLGPHARFVLSPAGDTDTTTSFGAHPHAASAVQELRPGRYVITVHATPWTSWWVRVWAV